jgi:hypothetical protein
VGCRLTEETKKKRPADDLVMCLNEVAGQVPVTKLFSRAAIISSLARKLQPVNWLC